MMLNEVPCMWRRHTPDIEKLLCSLCTSLKPIQTSSAGAWQEKASAARIVRSSWRRLMTPRRKWACCIFIRFEMPSPASKPRTETNLVNWSPGFHSDRSTFNYHTKNCNLSPTNFLPIKFSNIFIFQKLSNGDLLSDLDLFQSQTISIRFSLSIFLTKGAHKFFQKEFEPKLGRIWLLRAKATLKVA